MPESKGIFLLRVWTLEGSEAKIDQIFQIPTHRKIGTYFHQHKNMAEKLTGKDLREAMLEIARKDEHSDLPIRTFRIRSNRYPSQSLNITIKARTKLGASICLIDAIEEVSKCTNYEVWTRIIDFHKYDQIDEYVDTIINDAFEGFWDEQIYEVTNKKKMTPFPETLIKGSNKH